MIKKPVYIKCPRCQLNYILKKDKYCEVCKKEMRAGGIIDDDDFDFDLIDAQDTCPVCKINFIAEGELMCESCLEESLLLEKEGIIWPKAVSANDDDEDIDLLPTNDDEDIDEELGNTFAKDLDDDFDDKIDEIDEITESIDDDDDFDDIDLDDVEDDDEEPDDDDYL